MGFWDKLGCLWESIEGSGSNFLKFEIVVIFFETLAF